MVKLQTPPKDFLTGFLTGHGLTLRKNRLQYMYESMIEYGDFIEFKIGRKIRTLMLTSPEGIEHVLVKNAKNYTKQTQGYFKVSQITGNGIFTDSGERWKTARRISAPLFTPAKLEGYFDIVKECSKSIVTKIDNIPLTQSKVDISSLMTELTLQVLGRCIFSFDLGNYSQAVDKELTKLINIKNSEVGELLPLDTPSKKRNKIEFLKSSQKLDEIILTLIEKSRSHRDYKESFIYALEQSPDAIDPNYVKDQVKTFAFAGHETSASVLAWTFYFLAKYEKLRLEVVDEILSIKSELVDLQKKDLAKFVKLEMFIKEVMRHRPPAWSFGRYTVEDDIIFGEKIHSGDIITLSPYLTHMNPRLYKDAQSFNPLNFSKEAVEKRHRCAYIPFGMGPRVCIGAELAMMEIMYTVIEVILNFDIQTSSEFIDIDPLISLRPKKAVELIIKKRAI